MLRWLSQNPTFSFVIGLLFGVLAVDVAQSVQLAAKLRAFAKENDMVVKYETLKANIRRHYEATAQKYHFFRPFPSDCPLLEHLKELRNPIEKRIRKMTDR